MNSYDKYIDEEELIISDPVFLFIRNKIKLSKKNKYDGLEIKFNKHLIDVYKMNDIIKIEEKVKQFLTIMSKNCKNFDPHIFLYNFKKTYFSIDKANYLVTSRIGGCVTLGTYANFFKLNYYSAVYHEFLHLASGKYPKHQFKPFDEGYTQYLEEKYFNTNNYIGVCYPFETKIMEIVELIFGEEELEKLYFAGNFDNLFKMINEYISDYNLVSLHNNLQSIYNLEHSHEFLNKKDMMQQHLNKVFEILLVCYLNKNYLIMGDNIFENMDLFKEKILSNIELMDQDGNKLIYNKIKENKFSEIIEGFKNKKIINRKD